MIVRVVREGKKIDAPATLGSLLLHVLLPDGSKLLLGPAPENIAEIEVLEADADERLALRIAGFGAVRGL